MIAEMHGIRQAAFWTTLIGESNMPLHRTLAWQALAERATKRNAFVAGRDRRADIVGHAAVLENRGIDVECRAGSAMEPARGTLVALLRKVIGEEELGQIGGSSSAPLSFRRGGAALETLDLPDGFRSTVAWLADLCIAWHEGGSRRSRDPADIVGIVLIDEIDLHLHANLQRSLVPRLRAVLPKVQFIVTTHSPLVLSSFDRRELVIFDRDNEAGIRELNRQLFGLSMDDIYQWLMDTSPESPVMEAMLHDADPKAAVLLAQSPTTTEREAEEKVSRRRAFLKRLQTDDKPAP